MYPSTLMVRAQHEMETFTGLYLEVSKYHKPPGSLLYMTPVSTTFFLVLNFDKIIFDFA